MRNWASFLTTTRLINAVSAVDITPKQRQSSQQLNVPQSNRRTRKTVSAVNNAKEQYVSKTNVIINRWKKGIILRTKMLARQKNCFINISAHQF